MRFGTILGYLDVLMDFDVDYSTVLCTITVVTLFIMLILFCILYLAIDFRKNSTIFVLNFPCCSTFRSQYSSLFDILYGCFGSYVTVDMFEVFSRFSD